MTRPCDTRARERVPLLRERPHPGSLLVPVADEDDPHATSGKHVPMRPEGVPRATLEATLAAMRRALDRGDLPEGPIEWRPVQGAHAIAIDLRPQPILPPALTRRAARTGRLIGAAAARLVGSPAPARDDRARHPAKPARRVVWHAPDVPWSQTLDPVDADTLIRSTCAAAVIDDVERSRLDEVLVAFASMHMPDGMTACCALPTPFSPARVLLSETSPGTIIFDPRPDTWAETGVDRDLLSLIPDVQVVETRRPDPRTDPMPCFRALWCILGPADRMAPLDCLRTLDDLARNPLGRTPETLADDPTEPAGPSSGS